MSNLIDRGAVMIDYLERLGRADSYKAKYEAVVAAVDNAPAVEDEPVRHGRWKWFEEWSPSTTAHYAECDDCGWQCSECENALRDMIGGYWDNPDEKPKLNFCPGCGAKMDDGGENE